MDDYINIYHLYDQCALSEVPLLLVISVSHFNICFCQLVYMIVVMPWLYFINCNVCCVRKM